MGTPQNLNDLFLDAVERFGSKAAALRYKANGVWHDLTHQEVARRVKRTALGLRELGVQPGDRVAILAPNCPEWAIADFACLSIRCADVPVYPTLPAKQAAYVLRDSGAVAVFVSDAGQYAKVAEHRADLPALRHVIMFAGDASVPGVTTIQAVEQLGAAAERRYPDYEREARAVAPDDLATLIYTSGTTGDPKGVMLTHRNFTTNVISALLRLPVGPADSALSLLPLSHSFERMAGHYCLFQAGVTICYAESLELVAANMQEVRPTIVLAVPRLYEKIYGRVLESALAGSSLKRRIFFWSKRHGEAWVDLTLNRQTVPAGLAFKRRIADRLVFTKLRARTGGRIRFFVSGGAPLSADIAKFFFAAGLPILEGYGLTETSPVICVNPFDKPRLGSVGPAIDGVEVRIASDGEILARGPNIMRGYYNKPEATRETIDADGWFQEHRAAAHREPGQDERVPAERRDDRRQAQVPHHARRAEPGRREGLGHRAGPPHRGLRGPPQAPRRGGPRGARGHGQPARPRHLRDAQEVPAAARGLHDRKRRADADHEGQAPGGGAAVPAGDRAALPERRLSRGAGRQVLRPTHMPRPAASVATPNGGTTDSRSTTTR
jgi:long-chain acyl-CoA synthetase